MQSRLLAAFAAGALMLTMVPAVASASDLDAGTTVVNVTVSAGTTLLVPGSVAMNAGFPGTTVVSTPNAANKVEWWSNESGALIKAQIVDFTGTASATIDATNLSLSGEVPGLVPFGGADVLVATVVFAAAETQEAVDSQDFSLSLDIPSVGAGTYSSVMTWSVVSP